VMGDGTKIGGPARTLTWFDLAICAALSTPPTAALIFALLDAASAAIGSTPVGLPQGTGAFFVNLAGLFGILWNVVMLSTDQRSLQRIDVTARFGVIALILYHISQSSLSLVFLLFVLTELAGGVAKLVWMHHSGRQRSG
jgi:hypothetical protein